jgi:hypothetical protein
VDVISKTTMDRLLAGEAVLGHFESAGSDNDLPGYLRWSAEHGAMVELLDPRWRLRVNTEHLTLHGLIEDSEPITLLDGLVRRTDLDHRVKRISAATLALGEHISPADTWERAIYATANLAEWSNLTGLGHSTSDGPNAAPRFHLDWQRPPVQEVAVRGARLKFATDVDRQVGLMPTYSLETHRRLLVEARRPTRIEAFSRRYAMPLLALTAFAADRPETLTYEHYIDARRRQRVELWRAGALLESLQWRPNALLFYASDLPDFRLAVLRWWRLYEKVRPALGIFGDYINGGSSFSPARLITLHTAITGYTDARHGHRDLRKLRCFAEVANELTGCSNDALALFGAARDYFAHLGSPGQRYTVAEIEAETVLATRRAAALMQAALLRELGFTKTQASRLLRRHYRNWAL